MKPAEKLNEEIEYLEDQILKIKLVKFRRELRKTEVASARATWTSIGCLVVNVVLVIAGLI